MSKRLSQVRAKLEPRLSPVFLCLRPFARTKVKRAGADRTLHTANAAHRTAKWNASARIILKYVLHHDG